MLEICNYPSSTISTLMEGGSMKQPQHNVEQFEFNLGRANELCCAGKGKTIICGQCDTCLLIPKLKEVKEWFFRLGDYSRKKFMLGLFRRIHSVDLLRQLVSLLQPVVTKDFVYARMRSQPSLDTDVMTLSADRALLEDEVLQYTLDNWDWFEKSSYWTKAKFAFSLLQICDGHLLHLLFTQANTLLVSEMKAAESDPEYAQDYMETSSIVDTEYSFSSKDHPELELLTLARTDYSKVMADPFTGTPASVSLSCKMIRSNTTCMDDSVSDSVDPALLVIPTSSKAYSGVAKHRDFIGCLPVHLAKCILSFLDQPSLFNALCVNQKWRSLVEEVHQEYFVNQSLWEEVMLMQGAAAQGANPSYANDVDVLVPELYPGTYEVKETTDSVIKTTFKSEINFKTAYSGVVTRKVIMEERNIYCGAYNVMVLCDVEDSHRVMHTDGGSLIALGSRDRKVRFIDCESGKEQGPVITGHAGSIRCVHFCEKKGIVFSGSYDTSIRCWSIETGQCLKIFRGHTDTVMTVLLHEDTLVSGSKDNSCKVWNIQTGKCQRSFRHRHPVLAVALSAEVCITGCEGGRVKVWLLSSGELIKNLSGHNGAVTSIKFDCWHIVTASCDGYALAWSSLGRHNRCLTALRHPKEVLCLEFIYLRVITGCADGRLRIWNMLNGQCCRIMRGNSRSDPILNIQAIGDRITLNTLNNLLVLNFEPVKWDYSLKSDKVPPLVEYGSYSDAPVRSQPYPYVRAQRMKKAGASNPKILHHQISPQPTTSIIKLQHGYHAAQLPHSAKSLSERSLESARRVQSGIARMDRSGDFFTSESQQKTDKDASQNVLVKKPPPASSSSSLKDSGKQRPNTCKSAPSHFSVTIVEKKKEECKDALVMAPPVLKRRVSWAFDRPLEPKDKTITLSEMKALLRSQIRMKAESIIPPDFIYLTVNTIQATMVPSETNHNTKLNLTEAKVLEYTDKKRPSSSPSRIDPRAKVPIEDLGLEAFMNENETISEVSDLKSIRSLRVKETPKPPTIPNKEVYFTQCVSLPVNASPHMSLHPARIKSTIPKGRVIRPISAGELQQQNNADFIPSTAKSRPVTAPVLKDRPVTGRSVMSSNIQVSLPGTSPVRPRSQPLTSTAVEVSTVPMLMYPKELKDKIEEIKQQRKNREQLLVSTPGERPVGKVSLHNNPLRNHIRFELRTHQQQQEHLLQIELLQKELQMKEQEETERKKTSAWLAKVKGKSAQDFTKKPWSFAPEIGE